MMIMTWRKYVHFNRGDETTETPRTTEPVSMVLTKGNTREVNMTRKKNPSSHTYNLKGVPPEVVDDATVLFLELLWPKPTGGISTSPR